MDLEVVQKAHNFFGRKDWHKNVNSTVVFTNFIQLLLNLEDEKRELIFELSERFTWITSAEYQDLIAKVLKSIDVTVLGSIKKVILFPVHNEEDEGTKSGHAFLYLFKGLLPFNSLFDTITVQIIEEYEELLDEKLKINDQTAIFLLDDFLGSGETIDNTLKEVKKNLAIKNKNLHVVSIASQQQAVDFLLSEGIPLHTHYISNKGITDNYSGPELNQKTEIMKEIELLIPKNKSPFGYNESEALISLIRTPNNTFPIFWKEHKVGLKKFNPPFPRF